MGTYAELIVRTQFVQLEAGLPVKFNIRRDREAAGGAFGTQQTPPRSKTKMPACIAWRAFLC
jgi:hypothetical protein